ncbi:MAG: TIGR02281 family clan AA aspartic protease [Pseudomonadales bacterium]|nr:TIGR02281 family clan AA aspartic protease [Pseudomonadales bacterium]
MRFFSLLLIFALGCHAGIVNALPDIQVNGLMKNQAVVTIDGVQHILKKGKTSPEGLTLVDVNTQQATFEWQGETVAMGLTSRIQTSFEKVDKSSFSIPKGPDGHYMTLGKVNGRQVQFLLDTGATVVAMDYHDADRLGIRWRSGRKSMSSTAAGLVTSYQLTLPSVTVGHLTVSNVQASVIVAEMHGPLLLGMSFLQYFDMTEKNNTLTLEKKY